MPARSLYRLPPNPQLEAELREAANRQAVGHVLRAVLARPINVLETLAVVDHVAGATRARDLLRDSAQQLEEVISKIETGEGEA
jgi:hypothetical protein